jgi:hypothetical protein
LVFVTLFGVVAVVFLLIGDPMPHAERELYRRADSLSALDPIREAQSAIARGDLRVLAICGYACESVGIEDRTISGTTEQRPITGMSDVVSKGVRRLGSVAQPYAIAYNRVIEAELRRRRRP